MKNKVIFIDARDPFSFEEGRIAGAINIYPDEASFHAASLKMPIRVHTAMALNAP
jgi:rhodanese-related sulfurtransferase